MTLPAPVVKSSAPAVGGLGARLKALADARGPAAGTHAFASRQPAAGLRLDLPAGTVVDINELLGRPATSGRRTDLGTGGDRLPREAGERRPDGQDFDNDQLLTSCSTAPRRWALLDKVQFLCRPADPTERGPAVCGCGYPADTADSVNIHLRGGEDGRVRAGVSGIYRCKSPHNCPICAPPAAKKRKDRLARAIDACYAKGGHVALVVLTASHSASSTLAEVKAMVGKASDRARSGRAWASTSERHQIVGSTVGPETTFSRENGPHYHQHLIVFSLGSTADAQAGADILAARYMAEIRKVGGKISGKYGTHVEVAADAQAAGEYAAKGSAAWEVSGSITKTDTRSAGSLTPWDLVNLAFEGDAWARSRWDEYVMAMKGARSCVISPSLKKALGLTAEPEDEDEEDGEQQHHEADDVVGRLPSETWRSLMVGHMAATFLARVEVAGEVGFDAVAVWATEWAADAESRIADAKAQREESKIRREDEARARRRAAAIEAEARRLIEHGGGRILGRTLDSVRLAAENVGAVHPDVDPVSVSEMLSAFTRLWADDVAAAA
jgi:hypothetical protein